MKLWIWILIAAAAGALVTWFVMKPAGTGLSLTAGVGATAH